MTVGCAEPGLVVAVDHDHRDEQRHQNGEAAPTTPEALLVEVDGQPDALPLLAVGVEHLVESEV